MELDYKDPKINIYWIIRKKLEDTYVRWRPSDRNANLLSIKSPKVGQQQRTCTGAN